jgi:hypothetical protein
VTLSPDPSAPPAAGDAGAAGAPRWIRDAVAVAALVGLAAAQNAPLLLASRSYYLRDLHLFFAPLRDTFADVIRSGRAPWWNPFFCSGMPMAADPNTAAFYPPNLIFALLPLVAALKAFIVFHVLFLGLGVYAGLRLLRLGPFPAWLGAALALCSGPVGSLTSFPVTLGCAVWLVPLAGVAWRVGDSRRAVAAGAVLFSLCIFAGEPQIALQALLWIAVFGGRRSTRSWGRILAVAGLGFVIAAPQVFGALGIIGDSARAAGRNMGPAFLSVRPLRALEIFWPGIYGDPLSTAPHAWWGRDFFDAGTPYFLSISLGLLPLCLLPAALRDSRGRRALAVVLAATVLSFGRFLPFGAAVLRLPGMSLFRYPEKWLLSTVLALAVAAAAGLSRLRDGDRTALRACGRLAAITASLSLLIAVVFQAEGTRIAPLLGRVHFVAHDFPPDQVSALAHTLAGEFARGFLVSGVIAAAMLEWRRTRIARTAPYLAAAVALIDLGARTIGAVPTVPDAFYTSPSAAIERTRRAAGNGRVFYDSEGALGLDRAKPFTGALFGLRYAANVDIDLMGSDRQWIFAESLQKRSFEDIRKVPMLALAGASVIDTPAAPPTLEARLSPLGDADFGRHLYRLGSARSVRLLPRTERAENSRQAGRKIFDPSFDPDRVAVVEGGPLLTGWAIEPFSVRQTSAEADSLRFRARSAVAAVLVVSTSWDRHWRARIDGRAAAAFPADAVFVGVEIPPGDHDVRLDYEAPEIRIGMALSLLTLAGLAGTVTWRRFRRAP